MNKLFLLFLASFVLGCTTPPLAEVNQTGEQLLLWPIGCNATRPCIGAGFPDVDRDNQSYSCYSILTYFGHEGTDIAVSQEDMDEGVPVFAALDGVVLWVFDGKYDKCPNDAEPDCRAPVGDATPGSSQGYRVCTEAGPYCRDSNDTGCFWCFYGGNVVVIRHNSSFAFATRYDHLRNGSITVKPGDVVRQGDVIGLVGSAGRSGGPHLHFEVWGSTFYDPVDPWNGPCGPNHDKIYWINRTELGKNFNITQ